MDLDIILILIQFRCKLHNNPLPNNHQVDLLEYKVVHPYHRWTFQILLLLKKTSEEKLVLNSDLI